MKNLNKQDIEFLIDAIKNGKEIPLEYKYILFPTKQKEYELVYSGKMRKEDVLADNEEAKAVPLQIEKIFHDNKHLPATREWHNLLVFGDNLQILKSFYRNKDPLIKDKIKGKVKLIYIDPPFATKTDFRSGRVKAYSDKVRGAEFVEFLRRRLIIAKELLADDGTIWVHLDYRKAEYIKVVIDEIFPACHLNTIYWRSQVPRGMKASADYLPKSCQQILIYKKTADTKPFWSRPQKEIIMTEEEINKEGGYKKDEETGSYYRTSDPGTYSFEGLVDFNKRGRLYVSRGGELIIDDKKGEIRPTRGKIRIKYYAEKVGKDKFKIIRAIDNIWTDIPGLGTTPSESTDYPTQKTESLLNRIIKACTEEGDLVMDFFAGSGTTLAVAEKLNRRWIGCDIGKLAIYTIQKRLLEIDQSKTLETPKKQYNKSAESFAVVTSGLYDLGKIFELDKDKYIRFVKNLFEIDEIGRRSISGIEVDGKKREFYAKIFPYWDLEGISVDEEYLEELHKNIGSKIDGKFYIVAPANNVGFISDYHEIGSVRYYLLKVPYQVIKELHKVQFKKFRQPQSRKDINDLDEAVGFHFIRPPEVKSKINKTKDKVILNIKQFESAYVRDEVGDKLKNFESLAMLLFDYEYDGNEFVMDEYRFADDIIKESKVTEEELRAELSEQKDIDIEIPIKQCGKQMMVIYVDIYGNEFREVINIKK